MGVPRPVSCNDITRDRLTARWRPPDGALPSYLQRLRQNRIGPASHPSMAPIHPANRLRWRLGAPARCNRHKARAQGGVAGGPSEPERLVWVGRFQLGAANAPSHRVYSRLWRGCGFQWPWESPGRRPRRPEKVLQKGSAADTPRPGLVGRHQRAQSAAPTRAERLTNERIRPRRATACGARVAWINS